MIAETIVNLLLDAEMDPGEFVSDYVTAWKNRLRTPGTLDINSSHGEFTVDQDGNVVQRRRYHEDDPDGQFIDDVAKFDLDEWRRYWREDPVKAGGMDILDVGWWGKDGSYSGPEMEWRADYRAQKAEEEAEEADAQRRARAAYIVPR